MMWVFAVVAVLALGASAVVGSGRWGSMPQLVDDRPFREVPLGPLTAQQLRQVRFSVVTRGYSMQQVDALLDQVAQQLPDEPADQLADSGPHVGQETNVFSYPADDKV